MLGQRLLKAILLVLLSIEVLDRFKVEQRVGSFLVIGLVRLCLPLETLSTALCHKVRNTDVQNDGN